MINLLILFFIFSILLPILSYLINIFFWGNSFLHNNKTIFTKKKKYEFLSIYECGFHPFSDSNINFTIQYHLIGVLFLVFDVELIFLFPWVMNLSLLSLKSFLIVQIFLIILIIGFIYEFYQKALDWNSY